VLAVQRASPAVVNIYTETVVEPLARPRSPFPGDPFFDDFFSDFFRGMPGPSRPQRRTSLGSGVIIRADGTIVTNEHVIVRASTIQVLMADKREFDAHLVGSDSDSDLAVLKIDAKDPLPVLPLAADDSLMIGETVIAIGNPFGLSHTVTTGVVSATGRTIQAGEILYHDFIQTDASINPGNSGGPLIDVDARLVGINTAIHREGEGIGFAIPARRVRGIVTQILDYGAVQPPWIGIQVQDLTPEIAFHFGVEPNVGVLVAGIEPGSPAEAAGVERGDIITHLQSERISSSNAYNDLVQSVTAGDHLKLAITRKQAHQQLTVEVSTLPADKLDEFAWRAMGVKVEGYQGAGVRVTAVRKSSPADSIGMRPDDAITSLGGRDIDSVDSFRRRVAAFRYSNNLLISVLRGRRLYRVTMPLERPF